MATGKILNLKGLENKSPKSSQSPDRFRVARNVYPTPNGRLIPRYDFGISDIFTKVKAVLNVSQYNQDTITLVAEDYNNTGAGTEIYRWYKGISAIPSTYVHSNTPFKTLSNDTNNSVMSYRRKNTTYFLLPYDGTLMKYDGVQISPAGTPQPKLNYPVSPIIAQPGLGAGPYYYLRIVQHTTDFDSNDVAGEYVQFPINRTGYVINNFALRIDGGGTNIIGNGADFPNIVLPSKTTNNYFKAKAITYNALTQDYLVNFQESVTGAVATGGSATVTGIANTTGIKYGMVVTGTGVPAGTTVVSVNSSTSITLSSVLTAGSKTLSFVADTNITNSSQIGSYVFVGERLTDPASLGPPLPERNYGYALRVKSVNPLVLDANNVKYLNTKREWVTATTAITGLTPYFLNGSNTFISVWFGLDKDGDYAFNSFTLSFPNSSVLQVTNIDLVAAVSNNGEDGVNQLVLLKTTFNEYFSIGSVKVHCNADFKFQGTYPWQCMTVYQGILLLSNDATIYYNDLTAGGSFEQLNAINYLPAGNAGDSQFGKVTAIGAAQDYLVVSRERKNYYLNGNIATGNYRIQEIPEIELGSWNNTSMILVKDSVIFLAASGIYQIQTGTRATEISKNCTYNFATYDSIESMEDVAFVAFGYSSDITNSVVDGITAAYDEYRQLLVFMKKGKTSDNGNVEDSKAYNACMVVNMQTGECYEWNGLIPNKYANTIAFINSQTILGEIDTQSTGYDANSYVENKFQNSSLSYVTSHPVKLYTTWLTGGEPSLEKFLLQLKMFGRIQSNGNTSSIRVCNYKDWDITKKITDSYYFPNNVSLPISDQIQYSHKKRFNSDKVLSASVGLEIDTMGVTFELDSLEIEVNSIQEGMKK